MRDDARAGDAGDIEISALASIDFDEAPTLDDADARRTISISLGVYHGFSVEYCQVR